MIQRDECLKLRHALLLHKATNSIVAAHVFVFVPKTLKDPHRGVTLLRRSRFVLVQDLQNPKVKRTQLWRRLTLPPRIFAGFRRIAVDDFSNFVSRMMKPPSHLANTHAIAMSSPNPSVIVHREHPRPSKPLANSPVPSRVQYGGAILSADQTPEVGPFCTPISRT